MAKSKRKMTIKSNACLQMGKITFPPGAAVEVEAEEAKGLIDRGLALEVESEKPTRRRTKPEGTAESGVDGEDGVDGDGEDGSDSAGEEGVDGAGEDEADQLFGAQ